MKARTLARKSSMEVNEPRLSNLRTRMLSQISLPGDHIPQFDDFSIHNASDLHHPCAVLLWRCSNSLKLHANGDCVSLCNQVLRKSAHMVYAPRFSSSPMILALLFKQISGATVTAHGEIPGRGEVSSPPGSEPSPELCI